MDDELLNYFYNNNFADESENDYSIVYHPTDIGRDNLANAFNNCPD